ncbi:MAG: hypothetical protein IGS38_17415 [Synechococcales cyanobacterium M58_A2018_015]|nr:hypothetical protein [Synechococcales cyanobacterium M58_A2018_015]
MKFQYEIVSKLGGSEQVGLRLKCVSQLQAEELHRALRERFKVTKLMPSLHGEYTHFTYVTATEEELQQGWASIETSYAVNNAKVVADYSKQEAKAIQTFKSWQAQFRSIIKQLSEDIPSPISTVQGINPNRIEQQIRIGQVTEAEEQLLQQLAEGDGNTLRSLITLYARTDKTEQLVDLFSIKRDEILALPVSGRLVEQLVHAHIQRSQQENLPELLQSAQQIAQEFLPELERIRQADGVRRLLHQAMNPQETIEPVTDGTLGEQLAQLVEIAPVERIPKLEVLQAKHPQSVPVLLNLAASYRAVGDANKALDLYQSIPAKTTEEQEEIQVRQIELLLSNNRFKEVINLLSDSVTELPPCLSGLRGAALYWMGQKSQARPFLEKAWQSGERQVEMLLPLARLWATEGNPENAAEVYLILIDVAPETLLLEDRAHIATLASLRGFGDISSEQEVIYYEQCIETAGSQLVSLLNAEDILKVRLDLWKHLNQTDKLLIAYGDWLDWLASQGQMDKLEVELTELRILTGTQQISRKQHFELLEGLEPYIDTLPRLRQNLSNEYQGLAINEIDNAIRQGRSEEAFFQDLKRALYYLSSEVVSQLVEYQQQSLSEAAKLGIQTSPGDEIPDSPLDLSALRLALVGGHTATRREVVRELTETYNMKDITEIAPSSESHISRNSIQSKISNCDLVAVITGYMGHDLSQIVSDLDKSGALTGQVILLPCRGKSGVVRTILSGIRALDFIS